MKRTLIIVLLFLLIPTLLFSTPQPSDSSEAVSKAIALFESKKANEARSFFLAEWETNPESDIAAYYLGRIAFDHGETDDAIDWLQKAVDLNEGNANYHMWLGRAVGIKAQHASIFKKPFLAKRTKKHFDQAGALAPDNVEARFELVRYYVLAPGIMGGSSEKAFAEAEEIRKRNSEEGYMAFGFIYEKDQKDISKAIENYEAGIAENPLSGKLHFALGRLYTQQGEAVKALETCRKVIDTIPDQAVHAYYWMGAIHLGQKEYEKAFANFANVLRLDSTNIGVYYQIGKAAAESGKNLDRGESCLKRFMNHESLDAKSLAWSHFRLGTIYEWKKEPDRARQEYHAALAIDGDHKESKKALKNL